MTKSLDLVQTHSRTCRVRESLEYVTPKHILTTYMDHI